MAAQSTGTPPDGISLVASPQTLIRGGDVSFIQAQLMLNGKPYAQSGYTVTFTVDNAKVGILPSVTENPTDANGAAHIMLISGDMPGDVKVTATVTISGTSTTLIKTMPVKVVDWGTIGGMVFSPNASLGANAKITLADSSGNTFMSMENPQYAVSDTQKAPAGSFAFYRIPSGQYTLDWSNNGVSGTQAVTVDQGTSTVIFNMGGGAPFYPGYADSPAGSTTLYGYVLDKNKDAVPSVHVTVYNTVYNSSSDSWDSLAPVANTTTGSSPGLAGLYTINNVPYGTYKVVAAIKDSAGNDMSYYAIVNLNSGGYCAYIVLPNYVIATPVYTAPVSTPVPSLTITPSPAVSNNSTSGVAFNVKKSYLPLVTLLIGGIVGGAASLSWISKFFDFIADGLKEVSNGKVNLEEITRRGIKPGDKKVWVFGLSKLELVVGLVSVVLIGLAFLLASQNPLTLIDIFSFVFIAGITMLLRAFVHIYVADQFKVKTEYRFWTLGTVLMFLTSIFLHNVFSQPSRILVDEGDDHEGHEKQDKDKDGYNQRKKGIIAISGSLVSLVLFIVFLAVYVLIPGNEVVRNAAEAGLLMNLVLCVYGLMPFKPMEGPDVLEWNKGVWATLFFLPLIAYFAVIIYVLG